MQMDAMTYPESPSTRILYYGAGWPTNIGNAFIDLGALALLRKADSRAQISFASEMPRWFFSEGGRRLHGSLGPLSFAIPWKKKWGMDNALDVASVTACDLVVIAGMAMCTEFLRVNGPTLEAMSKRGVPVMLMGTGAAAYTGEERKAYGGFLRKIRPIAFISRDRQSFQDYAGFFDQVHEGIDCGFFVPDAFRPLPLILEPYVVLNFDSLPEPEIDAAGRMVLRSHHGVWRLGSIDMTKPLTLVSDIPHDYLALYASAEEVHSDRVHACVAALAYGRAARLYHPTSRGRLFEAAGACGIRDELTWLDMGCLMEKRRRQIQFVKDVLASLRGTISCPGDSDSGGGVV